MKIYLSGKITGDSNYKTKFNDMAERLTKLGYAVYNPSVLPDGFEYEDYMKIDITALSTCDAIFLLDDWKQSPGAIREKEEAEKIGLKQLSTQDIIIRETLLKLCEDTDQEFLDKDSSPEVTEYRKDLRNFAKIIKDKIKGFDINKTEEENFLAINRTLSQKDQEFLYSEFINEGDLQIEYDINHELTDSKKRQHFTNMMKTARHIKFLLDHQAKVG